LTRILYYLLIFLLPIGIYTLWIILSKGKIMNMKFFWPLVIGLFLMTSSLFISALFYENPIGKKYNHPEVINGELREGFFTK
jgi:hypothetical protein